MPASSVANEVAASVSSNRSRPGSSAATRDVKAETNEESGEVEVVPAVKVATVTLTDGSTYHGEVNADGIPDGVGVLLSVFGGSYSGAMKDGKKNGAGVELQPNGTFYSGEFCDGVASGYGVYVGVLGSKYIGQWGDGARHGVGVCLDADAAMTAAHFNMDEAELSASDTSPSSLDWEEDVLPHVMRAVLAEKTAINNQEAARQRHIDAVLHDMTAIGSEILTTPEAIAAFEAKEQQETADFIQDQSDQMRDVNAVAAELKFTEAQLTQRQKELRAEISAKRQELSFMAKYCALAETRQAQALEAERTLASLQRQLDVLAPSTVATDGADHGLPRTCEF